MTDRTLVFISYAHEGYAVAAAPDGTIVAGDALGRVHRLRLEGA